MTRKADKTQNQLCHACLALMYTKSFNEITVKDICKEADVTRGVFYNYFDSKYSVLEHIEKRLIDGFIDIMLELRKDGLSEYRKSIKEQYNPHFTEYFKYIRKEQYAFKALLCTNNNIGFSVRFTRAIGKIRAETVQGWNNKKQTNKGIAAYREEATNALYITVFTRWLSNGMDLPEEEMSQILISMWNALSNVGIS